MKMKMTHNKTKVLISILSAVILLVLLYIFSCLVYAGKHVMIYETTDSDRTIVLNAFGISDQNGIDKVFFLYKNNTANKYCIRIQTSNIVDFFDSCISGECTNGTTPLLDSYSSPSYKIDNFENKRLDLCRVFSYLIHYNGQETLADVTIYPSDDNNNIIEIAIEFPYSDVLDSIVEEHWWDDMLLVP